MQLRKDFFDQLKMSNRSLVMEPCQCCSNRQDLSLKTESEFKRECDPSDEIKGTNFDFKLSSNESSFNFKYKGKPKFDLLN